MVGQSLLRQKSDKVIHRLPESILSERLSFQWWFCSEEEMLPAFLKPLMPFFSAIPHLALPKIILHFRKPLRPFAVREREGMQMSWHSKLQEGDVLVVDRLRSLEEKIPLPGNEILQEVEEGAEKLRLAILQDPQEALELCNDLELRLPSYNYPRLGDRYEVQQRPALLRRFEPVESDLLGEVRVGKSVSIIKHGNESPGRVHVYTEEALVMPGGRVFPWFGKSKNG